MAVSIPSKLVEFILLGPEDDRRQLQDSPILGDVWIEFAMNKGKRCDLLISPYKTRHAGEVANAIDEGLGEEGTAAEVAHLQGLIAARLSFEELIRVVVPKTKWWIDKYTRKLPRERAGGKPAGKPPAQYEHEIERRYFGDDANANLTETLTKIFAAALARNTKATPVEPMPELTPIDRFAALTGLILWAGKPPDPQGTPTDDEATRDILQAAQENMRGIVQVLDHLAHAMLADTGWRNEDGTKAEPLVWQVSLNRQALPALKRSVPAVKADAATTLFKVDCSEIAWAVLDSGIDGGHPAFKDRNGADCRVKHSFDFKSFRKIVSLRNRHERIAQANADALLANDDLLNCPSDPVKKLKTLADDALNHRPIHWDLVEPFVEIRTTTPPASHHGTHVAGIIGANKNGAQKAIDAAGAAEAEEDTDLADGMCPDISLYDFRVLAPTMKETEFAIIAALQFVRYLNDRNNFITIHGANLSLSIPHDVRNFACGRTPVCEECERLVESGVVVVAAAGNHGYQSYQTKDGAYEGYTAFSITDPGNATSILTVGSTHRYWPHTYGVSFFSSRGPTGDGRAKPDLVAPGERIHAPFPGGHWGDLDGTSMAAPHVSGAAAMLMARYSELIGQPHRIKQILCATATDLGRERSFQGHGMLDVLRALQSL